MSIVIINPNSTTKMTDAMIVVAQKAAPDLHFEGWTSREGPAAIQGPDDGDLATPPLLELVARAGAKRARGIIIGCFDDTGLEQAAKLVDCPVIGIGQAAFQYCALRQWRFSVVTTLDVSVPIIERNIERLGLERHIGRVRASGVPVLDIDRSPENANEAVVQQSHLAVEEDGVDAIILGCAGMVHLAGTVRDAVATHVLDPVETAATCMSWLALKG